MLTKDEYPAQTAATRSGRMQWWHEARFGMFVHWSHSSQQGIELSWPMVGGVFALPGAKDVSIEKYHGTAHTFDPQQWNARDLARVSGN